MVFSVKAQCSGRRAQVDFVIIHFNLYNLWIFFEISNLKSLIEYRRSIFSASSHYRIIESLTKLRNIFYITLYMKDIANFYYSITLSYRIFVWSSEGDSRYPESWHELTQFLSE